MTIDYSMRVTRQPHSQGLSTPHPERGKGEERKERGNECRLRGILAYCSIDTRGCPCLCSQMKVKPFMKLKTNEGKDHYDLWSVLEGKGASRGSVLQARCKCEGGRDGACNYIEAATYALEDLLNTRDEDSVTSGPCVWVRRPRANTQACAVKDLAIEKGKKPSHKKRKRKQINFTLKTSRQMSVPLKTQIQQMRSIYESLPNDCAT